MPSTDTLILLFVALINAYTAYKVRRAEVNIEKVEKATNSMKDALVVAAGKAGFTEGLAEGSRREKP